MPSNDMTGPLPQSLNSLNPTAHVDLPSAQPERPTPASARGPERRAYLCNFCQRSFKRSDTRRLHFGRCPSRISTGKRIPPAAQKGRKPRACDACAHRKRACNEETPCSQCVTRKIACTRNRAISSKSADVINGLVANKQPSSDDTNQGPAEPRISDSTGDVSNDNIQPGYALPDGVEATWLNDTYADFGNGSFDIVPVNTRQYDARSQSPQSISRTLRPTIYDPPPSPLTFLLNFTTSSGIATSFNFAFYGSVHKSRKAPTAPSTSWQETGLRQHAYFDGLNRQTEPFVQFMTNNLPFNSIGTSAGSAMQLGFNNFDFPPRGNANNYPSFSGQDLRQTGDYTIGYQAEHTSCPEATNMVEVLADSLFPRTREIMLAIHSISTSPESWGTLPQIINQASAGKNTEATRCLRYFSPNNLRRFLGIFWDDWFPHCPIFHRPSFDIQLAPLSLLMAMTLMGAALSPYSQDSEETKEWMDYVEEIAFQKACAKPTVYDCAAPNPRVERPMSLQAAFLISCLQNWEGSTESRTRVRRQRYSTLTDLARAVGFDRATHEGGRNWETDHSHFDWPQFIAIEENIRIFTFIFLVDSSYVIFNNSPLKVLLQELTFDLICPASCFTAENSKSCFFELQRLCPAGSLRSRLSFIEAVQILHQNTFDEETSAAFLQLDSVNLFSILSAIYVTISQQTTSLFGPTSLHTLLPSIHNSLSTWSLLWNARSDLPDIQALETAPPHTVEPWKRVGFFQHADEYRVFSLGVLQLLQRGHQRGRQAGVGRTKVERPLPKFDETSMEQVTRLLCSLDVTDTTN